MIKKLKSISIDLFYLSLLFMTVLFFQNCNVQKPRVEDASSMSVGFVHDSSINSCSTCHENQRPNGVVGASLFNHALGAASTSDCMQCHDQPGRSWASAAKFSHSPIPASCSGCHDAARPAPTLATSRFSTGRKYLHASGYNGMADCALCHTQQDVLKIGVSWANGVYNHRNNANQSVTDCLSCHSADRPVALVGASNFNHSTNGQGDCFACHKSPGTSWSTEIFSHSPVPVSCNSCHNSARPPQTQYFAKDPTKPNFNLYVHATVYNGSSDCVGCHTAVPANVGTSWAGGRFNHKNNLNQTVTSCKDCHGKENPGVAGSPAFDHATIGTADCVSCHGSPGVTWSGAQAVPATITLPAPTGSTRPPLTIAHPVLGPNVTCLSCHSSSSYKPVIGFDHSRMPAGTACVYCHQTGQTVVTKTGMISGARFTVKSNGHEGANLNTRDCTSCHSSNSYPTKSATLPGWTSGSWGNP